MHVCGSEGGGYGVAGLGGGAGSGMYDGFARNVVKVGEAAAESCEESSGGGGKKDV